MAYLFNYSALPSLAALAVLVAVFRSILRRDESEQLNLWLVGWVLVLIQFVAQFLEIGDGLRRNIAQAVALDTLELAGVAFLVSVTFTPGDHRRKALLAAAIGFPALGYTNALVWNWSWPVLYYVLVFFAWAGVTLLIWDFYRKFTAFVSVLLLFDAAFACLMSWMVARATPDLGVIFSLSAIYAFVAVFYWRNRKRASAGVLTTAVGFLAWALAFPVGLLLSIKFPRLVVESQVWNIPKYFVAVGMILTLLEEQVGRSEHLAYHDALTGLPNRRLLVDRMEQALENAERSRTRVAVLVLDLDTFKQVNDTLGHRVGDLVLKKVVERLLTRVRASDTLARSGGDEFTIISNVSDIHGAKVLASGLVQVLQAPFDIEKKSVTTAVSVGVAMFPENGHDPDNLRAAADNAMYDAKRSGGSRYACYTGMPPTSGAQKLDRPPD